MSCPKALSASCLLYPPGTLQIDVRRQMSCELHIYRIALMCDSANSCNFTDCVEDNGSKKNRNISPASTTLRIV